MTSTPTSSLGAICPDVPLTVREHGQILGVLTDCASARTANDFRGRAIESLSRHLGYSTATVFTGSTLATVFADPQPLHTGRAITMFPEYHEFWFRDDFFATPQSLCALQSTRVSSLSELGPKMSMKPRRFVTDYLHRGGLTSAVGLYLQVSRDQKSLISLFGRQEPVREKRHAYLLRRLAEPLNAMSRSLPVEAHLWESDVLNRLTSRQKDVAALVSEGLSNATIADLLGLREDTVKKYVSGILTTLRCDSRTQVALLLKQRLPVTPHWGS